MSPTATIASVVVALLFFAWLFQSDVRDPGYDAWVKRQQDEVKAEKAQKAAMGIAVTDSGVTKDSATLESRRGNAKVAGGSMGDAPAPIPADRDIVLRAADNVALIEDVQDVDPDAEQPAKLDQPEDKDRDRTGFGKNARLSGAYVGVAYVGDTPKSAADFDAPSITFRRDGSFATQNMAAADVDMEAGGAGASVDRGTGRYKLWDNTLELTYTDGLTRKKGAKRVYTVVPVSGPDRSPTAITIQGKVFKLDPRR
jgi:hypothetical protein